jgi:hypothetical protein
LIERLQSAQEAGKQALMARMEVGLREQVSVHKTAAGHRRAHNRPKKRLERLLHWEEEMRDEEDEGRWTDVEIDWIIDQEELLPTRDVDEDKDHMDVD